jgi:cytochrome oxidase Cu insertion factor (SCO1/SenC/PrrC family)
MKLSLKAIRFVIESLENQQKDYDRQLADEGLSADDIADLTNDRHNLDAIKKDFETYRDHVVRDRENVGADV